jgi:hypothetical protein
MDVSPLPDACDVAFKEWAGVCRALADGRQALILRKGGIEEGPTGFVPEHETFWLYPTHLHEAQQGLRIPPGDSDDTPEGHVPILALARVASIDFLDRLDLLPDLEPWHVWTDETVRKRFEYRRPGLWVLGVRIYSRPDPWLIPITPEQAGCRTWVQLDSPLPTAGLSPTMDDDAFALAMSRLRGALSGG